MANDSWLYNPNLYQRHGCVFQAYGMNFKPEEFLRETIFDPKLILFHGSLSLPEEIKSKIAEDDATALEVFETAYLLLTVSEAEQSAAQIVHATAFLNQYQDEIKRLRDFPQVETVSLKFTAANGEPPLETLPDDFLELASAVESIMF